MKPRLRRMVRAVSRPAPGSVHLIVGPAAAGWIAQMQGRRSLETPCFRCWIPPEDAIPDAPSRVKNVSWQ